MTTAEPVANEEIALLKKQLAAAESFAADKLEENKRLEAENAELRKRLYAETYDDHEN